MNVKRIYLMGMKHTGKSVHGRALAERLGARFYDIDTLVQELDSTEGAMRRPVRDIYREDGAERFRQLEAAACRLAAELTEELVVSTGGGICDNPEALEAISDGLRVHLRDSYDAIAHRIFRGGIPAFLHTDEEPVARSRLRELYDRRVASYDGIADLTIDLTDLTIADARSLVLRTVEEHINGGK